MVQHLCWCSVVWSTFSKVVQETFFFVAILCVIRGWGTGPVQSRRFVISSTSTWSKDHRLSHNGHQHLCHIFCPHLFAISAESAGYLFQLISVSFVSARDHPGESLRRQVAQCFSAASPSSVSNSWLGLTLCLKRTVVMMINHWEVPYCLKHTWLVNGPHW